MAVPKRRTSKTRRDKRRSHDSIDKPGLSTCPACGESRLPHRVCVSCGWYGPAEGGRYVVDVAGQAG